MNEKKHTKKRNKQRKIYNMQDLAIKIILEYT